MRHPVYNNDASVKRHGDADALAFSERHFALVAKFRSCRLTKARAHLNLSMETQLHHPFMRSPVGGDHDSRLSVHSPFRNNGLCRCQRASAQKQVDGEDPVRLRIVDDLIKSKRLDSLSRADIVKLLGEPAAADYFWEYDLVYWLGPERRWISIDSEYLAMQLDKYGIVRSHRIVRD